MAGSTNPLSALIGSVTEFFNTPVGKVASVALAGVGTAVAADMAVQTGTAKNLATMALKIAGIAPAQPQTTVVTAVSGAELEVGKHHPKIKALPGMASAAAEAEKIRISNMNCNQLDATIHSGTASSSVKALAQTAFDQRCGIKTSGSDTSGSDSAAVVGGVSVGEVAKTDECLECRDFRNALYATAVGLVEEMSLGEVGDAAALIPPPDPNNPKYAGNYQQYQHDYTAWQRKVSEKRGREGAYERGARKARAKDSRKLAAQRDASHKILDKVKSSYQARIEGLRGQLQNAKNDAERQQLQSQIDALVQQQQAAVATQTALARDASSDKSVAMQVALIQAAQNKPDDLTGMFGEMMKFKTMQTMLAPSPIVAPSFAPPWSAAAVPVVQPMQTDIQVLQPVQIAPIMQPMQVDVPVFAPAMSDEAEYEQALAYSVSGSEDEKDLEDALAINGIAEDLNMSRMFDAAPEPCDTGCAS